MKTLIVTRHPAAVQYCQARFPEAQVVEHLDLFTLTDPTRLVGILPVGLTEWALDAGHEVILVALPTVPEEWRGRELSVMEMEMCGASLRRVISCRTELELRDKQ